jgi:hypothetical protein
MNLLDQLKKHDDTTILDYALNRRIASGNKPLKKMNNDDIYDQYSRYKSAGVLAKSKKATISPDFNGINRGSSSVHTSGESNVIKHDPGMVQDANDYIFNRGVNRSSGCVGTYKFTDTTCITANAGYFIYNGAMCYLHSDGQYVLLNSLGGTRCLCGTTHFV